MHLNRILSHANRGIVLLTASSVLWAGNIPIRVTGSTQTQIIIKYTATSTDACTITAVDNNGGPSVHDVDAAIFANANLDLGRTPANGFRWPTMVNNMDRTVFVGGHDEVKQGTDGKWYSTALQVN